MVSNVFLGEVRIPVAEHKDMSYEYAVQHWFPLFNPKHNKKDGSAGELGIKIGAVGGDVGLPPLLLLLRSLSDTKNRSRLSNEQMPMAR